MTATCFFFNALTDKTLSIYFGSGMYLGLISQSPGPVSLRAVDSGEELAMRQDVKLLFIEPHKVTLVLV